MVGANELVAHVDCRVSSVGYGHRFLRRTRWFLYQKSRPEAGRAKWRAVQEISGENESMRTLKDHIVEGDSANHQVTITVMDQPGAGGACHRYDITGFDASGNPVPIDVRGFSLSVLPVVFQNGPIKEWGVNGVTQEALLAIVIDRLRSFQKGPFSCRENAI